MQEKVKEFQKISGQPVGIGKLLDRDFRDNLLKEEVFELQEALFNEDRVEILDALCDIKYVNDGTANELGVVLEGSSINITKDADLLAMLKECKVEEVEFVNSAVYELVNRCGFTMEQFNEGLNRVHESNMSKFCTDEPTALETKEFYAKQGISVVLEPRDKVIVVMRESDGKVLKSVKYHPVYLEDLCV